VPPPEGDAEASARTATMHDASMNTTKIAHRQDLPDTIRAGEVRSTTAIFPKVLLNPVLYDVIISGRIAYFQDTTELFLITGGYSADASVGGLDPESVTAVFVDEISRLFAGQATAVLLDSIQRVAFLGGPYRAAPPSLSKPVPVIPGIVNLDLRAAGRIPRR